MPDGDALKREAEDTHYGAHAEDGADEVRDF